MVIDFTRVNKAAFAGQTEAQISAEIGRRMAILDEYNSIKNKDRNVVFVVSEHEVYNGSNEAWSQLQTRISSYKNDAEKHRKTRRNTVCGFALVAIAGGLLGLAIGRGRN